MKRIFFFIMVSVLFSSGVFASKNAPAVLQTKDGKALRVFLLSQQDGVLILRLEKGTSSKTVALDTVAMLKLPNGKLDPDSVQTLFNQAEYDQVIGLLDPILTPYGDFISVTNNLQSMFGVLMEAYYWNEDYVAAGKAAANLLGTQEKELHLKAQVIGALAGLGQGNTSAAEAIQKQIQNPAAALYVRAEIERAQGNPREAIQTAVELIATHVNDLNWMPSTELLCAELYLEMEMTNSARATARQTEKIYVGLNIEKEAEALRLKLGESTNDSE